MDKSINIRRAFKAMVENNSIESKNDFHQAASEYVERVIKILSKLSRKDAHHVKIAKKVIEKLDD